MRYDKNKKDKNQKIDEMDRKVKKMFNNLEIENVIEDLRVNR